MTSLLAPSAWRPLRARHQAAVTALVAGAGDDPVTSFLFTYYSHRRGQLRRWHPGFGVTLQDADEYAGMRGYELGAQGIRVSAEFLDRLRAPLVSIVTLLAATASRTAHLSCFGLHEWAMVYHADGVRHPAPLRLGAGTDLVTESMPLRCTHYDAFRFFTPDAAPRNTEQLTRARQNEREQPGCLHANMDLYKWCYKLVPLVDSGLLLDCFRLAHAARELDMRASPYDLSGYGYEPVCIETAAGRAEYVRAQSALAGRAAVLRTQLLERCRWLLGYTPAQGETRPHAHSTQSYR